MIFDILNGGFNSVEVLVVLVAFALSIIIAITFHEFAHAFTALKAGDDSAKRAGRLSLNPMVHFEPLGLLCFIFAGIGWAKPVPVNKFNFRDFKKGNFWVSISGVIVNITIGFICSLGFYIAEVNAWYNSASLLLFALYWFFMLCMMINISLAVFNLLPIPPLDGYNMLVSFTKPNNGFMKSMRENSMIILLLFVFFGGVLILSVRGAFINSFLWFWGLFI